MTNERKLITLTISADDPNGYILDATKTAAIQLSKLTGGCNIATGTGLWSSDADVDRCEYRNVNSEPSIILTVAVNKHDVAVTIEEAKYQLAYWLQGTAVDWIDCTVTDVTAHHFSIKA